MLRNEGPLPSHPLAAILKKRTMAVSENKGIKISPNFYQQDWTDLDLSKDKKDDWNRAIEIFKDRIEGRYFKQIQTLDENKDRSVGLYSGFAIMSLTCLLIETIEQFWSGNIATSKGNTPCNKRTFLSRFWRKISKSKGNTFLKEERYSINNDSVTFYRFFQRSENLKSFFDTEQKADVFYNKIRCGLLHQGQTKGKSLIHIRENEPVLRWINEKKIEDGISIQRRLFIKEIRIVYDNYITELEKPNNLNFRKKTLEKKMKFIVEQK